MTTEKYQSILHSSLMVKDTQLSLHFYHTILGIPIDNKRPDLGFAGAWLKIGSQQIHLLELPNPDPIANRPAHGGRDRHIAIAIRNINELIKTLEKNSIAFTTSKSGRKALFCRDPDGNALEFIQQSNEQ